MNVLSWDVAALQLFLVVWFTLYAYAGNRRSEPFWAGFLNPFGIRKSA